MKALVLYPELSPAKSWIRDQLDGLVRVLKSEVPGLHATERDLALLATAEVPHMRDLGTEMERHPAYQATRARSDRLIAEVAAADLVIIGAPIGQHAVTPALAEWFRRSTTSKAYGAPLYPMCLDPTLQNWFSHVIRADKTFRYTSKGPRGMLGGKQAIVLSAHAGRWLRGPIISHQIHCIHTLLRFMGINEITTLSSDRETDPALQLRLWEPENDTRRAA
jgi:FMN-dependent NADH-azoreductase